MSAETTVKVLPAGGTWETIGADQAKGIMPENLSLTADTWGPLSASFLLRRDPDAMWSDLAAGNQVAVEVGGIPVWGGRITQTPTLDGPEPQIAVSCRGWQDHLADDQVDKGWVHTDVAAWRDQATFPSADLSIYVASGRVTSDRGSIQIALPQGSAGPANTRVGVTLDLGPNRLAAACYVDYNGSANSVATLCYIRNHKFEAETANGAPDFSDVGFSGSTLTALGASGTSGGNFATARRYVTIFFYLSGAWTAAVNHWLKIYGIRVYTVAAHHSSGASILKADDVVRDTLTSGALPLLSTQQSRISDTTFSIPEFWPDSYRTPRELLDAVNAYHDYLVGVDAEKQLYFRPRPTDPLFEVGKWSGAPFSDASANSLDDIYNKVIVEYTAGDGTPGREARTATSSILNRQGFAKTKRLQVSAALTPAAAQQIGDTWLTRRANAAPLRGSITVGLKGSRSAVDGTYVHPSEFLRACGERLRLAKVDPEKGHWGRTGQIVGVSYDAAAETATLQLDNDMASFEAFLSRLGAIQGAR